MEKFVEVRDENNRLIGFENKETSEFRWVQVDETKYQDFNEEEMEYNASVWARIINAYGMKAPVRDEVGKIIGFKKVLDQQDSEQIKIELFEERSKLFNKLKTLHAQISIAQSPTEYSYINNLLNEVNSDILKIDNLLGIVGSYQTYSLNGDDYKENSKRLVNLIRETKDYQSEK